MIEKIATATAKAAVTVTDNSMGVKVTYVMVNSANSLMIIKRFQIIVVVSKKWSVICVDNNESIFYFIY